MGQSTAFGIEVLKYDPVVCKQLVLIQVIVDGVDCLGKSCVRSRGREGDGGFVE